MGSTNGRHFCCNQVITGELRRFGSVLTHARIWWQWHLTGEAGEVPVRMVMFRTLRGQDLLVVAAGVRPATFETE